MNATPTLERQVERWTPPLDADGLKYVLERFHAWKPLDVEQVFDDLDAAIGNQPPPVAATAALVERLRVHLKHLSDIAVADDRGLATQGMLRLVQLGRPLRAECTPVPQEMAVGLARRLAFVTCDLVEELIEARYIEGPE
ncbi:DUF6415 family natural product biosynthesis protein [Streptomyces sp. NPDC048002]|uniref:DUF6415 family natural product biosynthesis protein n=1 Tax=Streptomyces sp. NPDC048002 TaxID=3154344 RepID=UPI0033C450BC